MSLRRLLPLLFILSLPFGGWAQIVLVGLPHSKGQKKNAKTNVNARKMAATLTLPFWEDFATTKTSYADTNTWELGTSIRVNDGMAIRPPSLRVATFDGVDSQGSPYSVTDVLAKGFADNLQSQAIDLSAVADADRSSVYLSYYYQMKGNGEIPDIGDRIQVSFLNADSVWVPVQTIENDGLIKVDSFYATYIQILDDKFFHDSFKFRIQNFARLSGPYDTWHVDYIYINKGRSPDDPDFYRFPDRTISEPLTNLFGRYRSIPIEHFLMDPSGITPPLLTVTNRNSEQVPTPEFPLAGQVVKPWLAAKMAYRIGEEDVVELPSFGPDTIKDAALSSTNIIYNKFYQFSLTTLPDLEQIAEDLVTNEVVPDSLGIELIIGVETDDNTVRTGTEGDYDPEIFAPIDFRHNDSTRVTYSLEKKYAYDDGFAEYGAGLNQPGAQLAYQYDLVGAETAFISHLEMYFPRFGDESSQVIEIRIWTDLAKDPVYTEIATLQRASDNVIWRKQLTETVRVGPTFWIGWKQNAAAVIAVGFDKNNDTGDKMFFNTSGNWEQNTLIHGSLMLRPVIGVGEPDGPVGLEDEFTLNLYPNPSSGTFYFDGVAEMISVYDMTGRSIPVMTETTTKETKLVLSTSSTGIYIVKAHINGQIRTAKVLVK